MKPYSYETAGMLPPKICDHYSGHCGFAVVVVGGGLYKAGQPEGMQMWLRPSMRE